MTTTTTTEPWQRVQLDQDDPKISVRADKAWDAIIAHGEHAHPERKVFLLGDRLVRVSKDDEAVTKLTAWEATSLTDHIDRIADCTQTVKGETAVVKTPVDLARNLLQRTPDMLPGAPRIARVTDVPVLGRDQKIIFEPGYHQSAQTYYAPAEGMHLEDASAYWSSAEELADSELQSHLGGWTQQQQDVREARDFLISVFSDFPFADTASWTHALCLMLEPFARELIGNKPTPMYAVVAELPNTGKSLLTQTALYPACAERTGVMTYTDNAESMRKLITSTLIEGGPSMWIDNIPKGQLMDSAVLAAALTAPGGRWDDRILGHSKMASVPIRNAWVMTANKPSISGELARRMIPIRLTVPHSDDYKFKLALDGDWLERHRAQMVDACLTLVLNYVVGSELNVSEDGEAYQYSPDARKLRRSYRAWSQVMGGIMQAARIESFLGNLKEWEEDVAVEVQDDAGLMRQWHARKAPPLRASELASLIKGYALPDHGIPVGEKIELPVALQGLPDYQFDQKLTYWLRDTGPQGGYRIIKHGTDSPYRWSVEQT